MDLWAFDDYVYSDTPTNWLFGNFNYLLEFPYLDSGRMESNNYA